MSAPAPPLFALPEYATAARQHFHVAISELGRARSALLRQIRTEMVEAPPDSVVVNDEGASLVLQPASLSERFELLSDDIVLGDLADLYSLLDRLADRRVEALETAIVSSLTKVTEHTGQVISADGRGWSHDLITDALERTDLEFDEQGRPTSSLLMHPADVDALVALPPPTPEQHARHEAMLERKRREAEERRRSRRLS